MQGRIILVSLRLGMENIFMKSSRAEYMPVNEKHQAFVRKLSKN